MITLITGAPGAGKSAALVALLADLAKGRPIYVDGIPDLKIPHVELEDPRRWHELVPDGAVVVIDEVQRVWRPTGPGQKVGADIAALETHRHRGLDFYIVTQHPKLLHANVRNLVGRHVHLRDTGVLGRWWCEWPEASDPGSYRSAPVKKRYRLPKASFGLYKSASEHIKPRRSIPPALFIFGGAVMALGVVGWYVWGAIAGKRSNSDAAQVAAAADNAQPMQLHGGQGSRWFGGAGASDKPPSWPRYEPEPINRDREPYDGRALELAGSWTGGDVRRVYFTVVQEGEHTGIVVPLEELQLAGYVWIERGPCTGLLRYGKRERVISCGSRRVEPRPNAPAAPAPAEPAGIQG